MGATGSKSGAQAGNARVIYEQQQADLARQKAQLEAEEKAARQTVLSDLDNQFVGAIAENYVTQQLAANGHNLFYWQSSNAAELDFVLQQDAAIIGVEVKSGLNVRSRSLNVFSGKYQPAYCIRFSLRHFGQVGQLRSGRCMRRFVCNLANK